MVTKDKKRVVVAMSGGVDSSVAAVLLARAGYEVVGVTMRLFQPVSTDGRQFSRSCCSADDVEDARRVCRAIGARHLYLNFEREFRGSVIDYFVSEYERGRTPHPCIACNDRMKFDFLAKRARALGFPLIATGHYAQNVFADGSWQLRRGVDLLKDQSYVLFGLSQAQLASTLFPVGQYTKAEIRSIAAEYCTTVADKPDSQEICFIPLGSYRDFIAPRLKKRTAGRFIDTDGTELGRHSGIHQFTIGQRKGLPLDYSKLDSNGKFYITDINALTGDITIGDLAALGKKVAYASRVNWISGQPPSETVRALVRVRYGGVMQEADVTVRGELARVVFDTPMRAVTPGQAIVFYRGDELLGGGFIEARCPDGQLRQFDEAAALAAS